MRAILDVDAGLRSVCRPAALVAAFGLACGLAVPTAGPVAAQEPPPARAKGARPPVPQQPLRIQERPLADWLDGLKSADPAARLGAVRALSDVTRQQLGDEWPALRARIDAMASADGDRGAREAAAVVAELFKVSSPEKRQEIVEKARRTLATPTRLVLVDPQGKLVAGAVVGTYFERDRDASASFAPHPATESRSSDDRGEAALVLEIPGHLDGAAVYAIRQEPGEDRPLVGVYKVTREEIGKRLTITMSPACRVRFRADCPTLGAVAARFNAELTDSGLWRAAYVRLGDDHRAPRPLFSSSTSGELEFFLPPGRYGLYVYGSELDSVFKTIEIADGQRVRSLGVVALTPAASLQQNAFRYYHHDFPPGPWEANRDADGKARVLLRPLRAVGLKGNYRGIRGLAYSPDGTMLATAHWYDGDPGEVKLWGTKAGEFIAALPVPAGRGGVFDLAFSPDGMRLAGAVGDLADVKPGAVAVWDLATRRPLQMLRSDAARPTAVSFSPDGKTLASGGDDRSVRFWDVAAGRETGRIGEIPGWVRSLAFTPDGQGLLLGSGTGARLWDVPGNRLCATLEPAGFTIQAVALSPDGRTAAAAGGVAALPGGVRRGQVRLYDLTRDPPACRAELAFEGNDPLRVVPRGPTFSDVAFTADGRRVVAVMMMTVVTWDAATAELRDYFDRPFGGPEDRLAASPRGHWLAVSGEFGTAMYDITPRAAP